MEGRADALVNVVEGLSAVGLAAKGRVIVEKPFGRDVCPPDK
jgi:glucose-6-phosphate 1-dehydrogenase